jgi:hypothetical protein
VTIAGLAIDRFDGNGIVLNNPAQSTPDTVYGCYIGTDLTGETADIGNTANGILVKGATNIIGASNFSFGGNVISGNGAAGVLLSGSEAQSNVIEGNYIGVDVTGLTTLPNFNGVGLSSGASNNTIGGITYIGPGVVPGNVISGNRDVGLFMTIAANGNTIQSNIIGLGSDGLTALPNNGGIAISSNSTGNTIGASDGVSGNVISGNNGTGVMIESDGNSVQGNLIGLAADGSTSRGNQFNGIAVNGSSVTIGGINSGQNNVISANGSNGVEIDGSSSTDNYVIGNIIGLNKNGTVAVGNGNDGVLVGGSCNVIGIPGGAPGVACGNLISGNGNAGVEIVSGASDYVSNNYIGTDVTGEENLGNRVYGVVISQGTDNVIGGTDSSYRNIISGNGRTQNSAADFGVYFTAGASGNTLEGNYIGLSASGLAVSLTTGMSLGNGNDGVYVEVNCVNNMIGGTLPGLGNVISANGQEFQPTDSTGYGVSLYASATVQNNIIGLKPDGTAVATFANIVGWKDDPFNQGTWLSNQHQ